MAELFNAGLALADVHLATKWREEEIKYRKLEILRRQIDEKVEQLRSIANLAALIAGFEVVVLIEIQVSPNASRALVAIFGFTTAITVCLMCISFITCTLMLVGVLKAFDLERAKMPFRRFWMLQCEDDWMRAFWFFTVGVPLFMTNLAIAAWVLYPDDHVTASLMSVVCFGGILMWVQVHLKWGTYLAQDVSFSPELNDPVQPLPQQLHGQGQELRQSFRNQQGVDLEAQQSASFRTSLSENPTGQPARSSDHAQEWDRIPRRTSTVPGSELSRR